MYSGRHLQFQRDLMPPSSILNMVVACYVEMLLNFYQTTQHHIPEDSNLLDA